MRQYQKEKKSNGGIKFIEADLEDYRIAFELGYEMLKSSFSSLTEDERRVLRVIVSLRKKGEHVKMEQSLTDAIKAVEEAKITLRPTIEAEIRASVEKEVRQELKLEC